MEPVQDLRDTRVLIPRLRRALDGPTAMSSAAMSSTLSDEQLNAIGADAIAEIIFYSGSLLGSTISVSERDPQYMSPLAWIVDPALTEPKVGCIVSQAALTYFYMQLSSALGGKTAEETADEATKWSWEVSPQAIVERLRQLKADRDSAIVQLEAEGEATDASWVSMLAVRDKWTSAMIEPWVEGPGFGGINDGVIYP